MPKYDPGAYANKKGPYVTDMHPAWCENLPKEVKAPKMPDKKPGSDSEIPGNSPRPGSKTCPDFARDY